MSIESILEERKKTHGDFVSFARIAQKFKDLLNQPDAPLTSVQREALEMITHKIARILNGDPNHKDHWDDIAGYATLVSNQLKSITDGN